MAVWAFSGNFGAGKTAAASYFAHREQVRRRCPIWSNYGLLGARSLSTVSELEHCKGGIIVLDELHDLVSSRSSMSKATGEFMSFWNQCRKTESEIFVISQRVSKMDKQVRDMIDIEMSMYRMGSRYSRLEVWDVQAERLKVSSVFDRSLAYGLYNHLDRARRLSTAAELEPVGKAASRASRV
jgi:hypothetical protein